MRHEATRDRLGQLSEASAPAGWRRLLVALLPLLGLVSYLALAIDHPTGDDGTLKTVFMLTTGPGWALGVELALDASGAV